jgi:hypothetical protein
MRCVLLHHYTMSIKQTGTRSHIINTLKRKLYGKSRMNKTETRTTSDARHIINIKDANIDFSAAGACFYD